ncbi:hypothetical protein ACVWYN_002489 [Pedobacter sp. UYP24]
MKFKIIAFAVTMMAFISLNSNAQNINIEGTWKLVAQKVINSDGGVTTSDSAALNTVIIYTPTMYVNVSERKIPQYDNQKIVISCAGGHYSLKGNDYQEFTEFASYKDYKDMRVKFTLTIENGKMHTVGTLSGADGNATTYDQWFIKVDVPVQSKLLTGNWKMVSQKVTNPDGSLFSADSTSRTVRKLFTPGMVVVIREQVMPEAGNQKIVVSCAGGSFTLKNGEYEELINFASYKDYNSMKAKFNLKIESDKLHTFGSLIDSNGLVSIYDEWYVKED